MIVFRTAEILNTHCEDGALQCTKAFVKDNKYFLLHGFTRIKGIRKSINFIKGWYDKDLNFISGITEIDQDEIDNSTPF